MTYTAPNIPQAFVWRRLHSILGVWLVIYLIEHLLVNSQAAFSIGRDGAGFIKSVNAIHDLPYLSVIEMTLLGFPFFVHIVWGIKYLLTSKLNSFGNTGIVPYLPEYSRNRAFTWQRITSWILIFAILAHVIHMRFIEYPVRATKGVHHYYMLPVSYDEGLHTLAARLNVELYDQKQIQQLKEELRHPTTKTPPREDLLGGFVSSIKDILQKSVKKDPQESEKAQSLLSYQQKKQQSEWIQALEKRPLRAGQVMTVSPDFGTAELLMLRDTFKMPIMILLYTLLVIFTCFHAFNGLWTAMISWGVTLSEKSQKLMLKLSSFLMFLVAFLGLAAVWATYWINLKY